MDSEQERRDFEAHLKTMPDWAPEFEVHRPWVEKLLWDAWRDARRTPSHAVAPAGEEAWRPIETAPKDQVFLGWIRAERWSAVDGGGSGRASDVSQGDFCWWRTVVGSPEDGYFDNGAGQIGDAQEVTHWQPLPGPPAAARSTQGATPKGGD